MTRTRMEPDERRALVITAGLDLAEAGHYALVLRDEIAAKADISGQHITYLFGGIAELRRCIMRAAVKKKRLTVIAQGVIAKDPDALAAPAILRNKAVKYLLTSV